MYMDTTSSMIQVGVGMLAGTILGIVTIAVAAVS